MTMGAARQRVDWYNGKAGVMGRRPRLLCFLSGGG